MPIREFDRPLGLGEILDRAVTISVQRFPMLIALLTVLAVPLAILQSFSVNPINQFIAAIQAATNGSKTDAKTILNSFPNSGPFDYAIVLMALLVSPLMIGLITLAVSRALNAELLTIGGIYRTALRRWPSALATGMVCSLALVALIFVSLVALILIFLVGGGTKGFAAPGAIGLSLLVAVLTVAIGIPLCAIGFAITIVSMASAVLETNNPFVAIGRSFTRIFARRELLRSIVISLVLVAINLVTSLIGLMVGGAMFAMTKWFASYVFAAQLFNAISLIFSTAMATVYYLDIRLRREGADLTAQPRGVSATRL